MLRPQLLFNRTRPRHLKLLIRLADQHSMPGALPSHTLHHMLHRPAIATLINLEPQTGQLVHDGGAQLGALLADASGEDQRVDAAAQGHIVGADEAGDAVDEDVERQSVRGRVGRGDGAEVGGTRERLPPALLVEDLFGLGDVELGS